MTGNPLIDLLVLIAIAVAIFMAFRQLVLWYWKVDEQVSLLREQAKLLREIRDVQQELAADTQAARARNARALLDTRP